MDEILKPLANVSGVIGVGVLDAQSQCVAHQLQPPFDPVLFTEVGKELRTVFAAVETIDEGPIQMFVAHMGDLVLACKQSGDWIAMVLGGNDVNTAMLGVALNMAGQKLAKTPAPNTPSVSFGSYGSVEAGPAPADALDVEVMREVLAALTKYVGPFAKVMLKKELRKLGLTPATVGAKQYADVIAVLASQIPDGDARAQFESEARAIKNRLVSM